MSVSSKSPHGAPAGFPGGSVVKIPPASAGDRFDPRPRKIPHAVEKLNLWVTTTEPEL